MNEAIWRRAEKDQARRERIRLTRRGVIRPFFAMQPQLMVKNVDDSWSPGIKTSVGYMGPKFDQNGMVR